MTFPGRFAPLDERLDALADLLERLPIEFDGVALNKSIVADLRDAALIIRSHQADCPPPERKTYRETTHGTSYLRRAYG